VPTRTVVLDLPVEVALARARSRATTTSANRRFEDEALAFHRQVAAGYRAVSQREPGRVHLVDASGSPQQVHERVLHELADLLP
jgi:dTMP kinase